MPQWFCCQSRSGSAGERRTQCGSWKRGVGARRSPSTTSIPSMSRAQVRPPSRDSCTPPLDMPRRRWSGSRGSTFTEWSFGPSGVPSCGPPRSGRISVASLKPATGSQVTPPSPEWNSPCGDEPAYQVPGRPGWPGVSQKVWSTARAASPERAFLKAGGRAASFQVLPRSVERKTVGPRWPVLAAARSVRPSRGSSTAWLRTWPRKCGPSTRQRRRAASPWRSQSPLRVATNSVGPRVGFRFLVAMAASSPGRRALAGRAVPGRSKGRRAGREGLQDARPERDPASCCVNWPQQPAPPRRVDAPGTTDAGEEQRAAVPEGRSGPDTPRRTP